MIILVMEHAHLIAKIKQDIHAISVQASKNANAVLADVKQIEKRTENLMEEFRQEQKMLKEIEQFSFKHGGEKGLLDVKRKFSKFPRCLGSEISKLMEKVSGEREKILSRIRDCPSVLEDVRNAIWYAEQLWDFLREIQRTPGLSVMNMNPSVMNMNPNIRKHFNVEIKNYFAKICKSPYLLKMQDIQDTINKTNTFRGKDIESIDRELEMLVYVLEAYEKRLYGIALYWGLVPA